MRNNKFSSIYKEEQPPVYIQTLENTSEWLVGFSNYVTFRPSKA